MKLAELAMKEAEPESEEPGEVMGSEDAISEALDLLEKGDRGGAVSSLKSAIELCVADYMAEGSEESDED